MITIIKQFKPHRFLHVEHSEDLEVYDGGGNNIVISYKDPCNTCYPMLYEIVGEGDLYVEVHDKGLPQ